MSSTILATEKNFNVLQFAKEYAVLILLGLLLFSLAAASPSFFTLANLVNILNQNAPIAIIAAAGTFVIVSGNFDLSTGAIFGVASVAAASVTMATGSVFLGLAVAPLLGVVLGALNGAVITKLKIHSFLATLASSMVYTAIAVLITGGALVTVTVEGFTTLGRGRWGGIFISIYLMIAVVAILWILMSRSVFGRHVYAVGGNPEASSLSGIRVDKIKIMVFGLSGLAAGLAASVSVSRIASGQPLSGAGLELDAIAAIILGGTSINGGVGAVWRSIAGVFLIALIGNGFDLMNINPQMKDMVTGLIILAAVGLAAVGQKKR